MMLLKVYFGETMLCVFPQAQTAYPLRKEAKGEEEELRNRMNLYLGQARARSFFNISLLTSKVIYKG